MWQLGMLGTISVFTYRHRETEKNTQLSIAKAGINIKQQFFLIGKQISVKLRIRKADRQATIKSTRLKKKKL